MPLDARIHAVEDFYRGARPAGALSALAAFAAGASSTPSLRRAGTRWRRPTRSRWPTLVSRRRRRTARFRSAIESRAVRRLVRDFGPPRALRRRRRTSTARCSSASVIAHCTPWPSTARAGGGRASGGRRRMGGDFLDAHARSVPAPWARKSVGRRAGAASAGARRAPRLYLQVEVENAASRALYAACGFSERYRYHYRLSS